MTKKESIEKRVVLCAGLEEGLRADVGRGRGRLGQAGGGIHEEGGRKGHQGKGDELSSLQLLCCCIVVYAVQYSTHIPVATNAEVFVDLLRFVN